MADYEAPIMKLTPEEKLARFREWFKLADEAEQAQRVREEEDLEFQVGENQWEPEARAARKGRPMLSVSLLHQPMQLVQNQAANAHLSIDLNPVSENSDKELAEVKQGLYSRIQRDGKAAQARLWALDRAKQVGRGFYRITTKYDEDSDETGDQEIVYERILHQSMVYVDPSAQQPDLSDARFMFQAAYMSRDDFREEYPKAEATNSEDFLGSREQGTGWVDGTGAKCKVLVAECFYKVPTARNQHVVHRAVLTGAEVIEDKPWMGGRKYIPIIPVIGRELQPIRGERRWEGMVRQARDAQRAFNYSFSSFIERIALEPKAPFVVYDDAIEPYQAEWDEANATNRPYLRVKMTTAEGKPVPLPQRAQVDGSGMSLAMSGMQQGRDLVQAATAVFAPSLGEMPQKRESQSGRAIMALQQQTDAGTSTYLDNLKMISLPLDARIVLDMMPVVYDRPGRITQILGAEDEPRQIMLNAPFVPDESGMPRPAPKGDPKAKVFDLSKGRYSIVATIGKGPQTRLEQGQEFLTAVMQAVPDAAQFMLDLVFKFRNEPGAKELSERFRRHIQQTAPHLLDDGKEPDAQALQAQAMAMQQQLQQMGQQLQQAMQYIQTEQAKVAGQVEMEQARQQAAVMIAKLKADVEMAIAQLRAQTELQKAEMTTGAKAQDMQGKVVLAAKDAAHESTEGELDRQHETEMLHTELAHEVGMARVNAAAAERAAAMQPQEEPGEAPDAR